MILTFQTEDGDISARSCEWTIPPRIGERVFLILDADSMTDKSVYCHQFDGIVTDVQWFGSDRAFVKVLDDKRDSAESRRRSTKKAKK